VKGAVEYLVLRDAMILRAGIPLPGDEMALRDLGAVSILVYSEVEEVVDGRFRNDESGAREPGGLG
jgi:hypothetical protein